jgi:hypothetical protein
MESRIAVGLGVGIAIGILLRNAGSGIALGSFMFLLPALIKQRKFKRIKS